MAAADKSGSESYENITRRDDSMSRYGAELGQVFSEHYVHRLNVSRVD